MKKIQTYMAMMAAAQLAMNFDRTDGNFRVNREQWRRRRKSKGGRKGKGVLEGLPHKAASVPMSERRSWHA